MCLDNSMIFLALASPSVIMNGVLIIFIFWNILTKCQQQFLKPGNSCCLLLTKDQFCQQLFVKSLVPQHCTAKYSIGRQSSNDKNHKNREQLKLQRLFTDFHAKMATRLIIPRIFIPFISLVLALNVEMSTTIFYRIQDESMSNIGSRTTFFFYNF